MRSRFSPILIVLFLATICIAQGSYRLRMKTAAEYAALQRQLVSSYCRLEFEGGRFTDSGWAKMKPLTRFKDNPDFRFVEIVSRYQVVPQGGLTSNTVLVSYTVLGRYEVGYGYVPQTTTSEAKFRTAARDEQLEITDVEPDIPRVSKRAAIQWLKEQLAISTNPIEKAQIEKSLQVLDPPAAPAAAPTPSVDEKK